MALKRPLPRFLQPRPLWLALIACLFVLAYTVIFGAAQGVYLCVVDAMFIAGVGYLVVGMSFYIHNIGLFKTFRYWGYRASARLHMRENTAFDAKPMDLAAFTQFILSQPKKPTAMFLLAGAALLALSALITILYGAL